MDTDGKRIHLIERAAVRLDRATSLARTAAAAEVVEPATPPPGAAKPGIETAKRPVYTGRPIIERTVLQRAGAADWDAPSSRVVEEFRIACTEVLRRSLDPSPGGPSSSNAIMITSALPGEGKSFTAVNLALGIAHYRNQRVLLIDADGKPGSLSDLLQASGEPGLLELAADRGLDASELVFRCCVENLDFLPFGRGGALRTEVLGNTARVIETLARSDANRLVVIDAPPCLSSSRPHLLAAMVGQAVLVVAAGITQQNDVEAAAELIRSCPGVLLLLNKVSRSHAHSYGSYAHST